MCYTHEKGPLSFVGCIRTTLAQVSVFEHGKFCSCNIESAKLILLFEVFNSTPLSNASSWNFPASSGKRATGDLHIRSTNASHDVSIMSGLMIHTMEVWMGSARAPRTKTMIIPDATVMQGMRSALNHEITTLVDLPCVKEMRSSFATMFVLAAYPNANREMFAMAGHQCLKWLDRKLKPYFLGTCSAQDLQALMLLVFGTIFSVASATPMVEHPAFPTDEVMMPGLSNLTPADTFRRSQEEQTVALHSLMLCRNTCVGCWCTMLAF